jgi:DNA-binding MarR family transcriptional regulator
MPPEDHVARVQAQWRRERPDVDVDPQGIVGRLHRLAAHLTPELVAVYREHGLDEGEFDVLATLRRQGPPFALAPSELAELTMVTTGAMSKRIDRLESAGLVRRRRHDSDGRGRVVVLTPEGRRRIDTAFTAHMANEGRLVASLTAEDRRQLERLLRTWIADWES